MPLIGRYEESLLLSLRYYERQGRREYARKGWVALLRMVLYDALLGRPLDEWQPLFEEHAQRPGPTHSELVVPGSFLDLACAAWLLGKDASDLLAKGWEAVDRAWQAATDDNNRRIVAAPALAIATGRRDAAAISHWTKICSVLPSEHVLSDVELIHTARSVERGDAVHTSADLMATLACETLERGGLQTACVAALAVQAEELDARIATRLVEGRRMSDEELWPDGDDSPPRADWQPLRWALEDEGGDNERLSVHLVIEGRGGPLRAPAALLIPSIAAIGELERLLTGGLELSTVAGATTRDQLKRALAGPDRAFQVRVETVGDIAIESDVIHMFSERLETAAYWLKSRHPFVKSPIEMTVSPDKSR